MPLISATIIAHNEARHIGRAIGSLGCADEIIVVDSGSADETGEIAQSLGARVIVHSWEGFAAQKNFAVDQARYEWILSLDADEELDARAQEAVANWKRSEPACIGYRFARRACYLGRWIRHSGWYPDYKLRLFDRRKGRWEGSYVHESVVASGPLGIMPGEILHYTCDSLDDHRRRVDFYTDLAAAEMLRQGRPVGRLRRTLDPPWTFLQTYVLRGGFLDGAQGFWIALMASRYVALKYAKTVAASARRERNPSPPAPLPWGEGGTRSKPAKGS
jgi:glycosyltransferase involved in cell wall biosynthesis